jgi:TolB-like protein
MSHLLEGPYGPAEANVVAHGVSGESVAATVTVTHGLAAARARLRRAGIRCILPLVPVSPEQVRGQLDRVLASEAFAGSARLSRFLRYVVERTLAGEGDRLKEYAVGVDVFDRHEGYDPRLDSLVRVEAGRLRSKLSEYYAGPGAADPVVIRVPRGSYAPVFEERANEPQRASEPLPPSDAPEAGVSSPRTPRRGRRRAVAALAGLLASAAVAIGAWRLGVLARASPSRPVVIAVLPFAHYSASASDETLAARLTDGVTSELARTGALAVVSHTSAVRFAGARRPLREIARELGADVVMEATLLMEGDRVRIQARLVDASLDRKVWVEDFVGSPAEPRELQQRIAASVTTAALRPRRR